MNVDTRESLHAVAEHVMAKASFAAIGKIGLRPHPGGFRTQEFNGQVLAVEDGLLNGVPIDGANLPGLVDASGVFATTALPYAPETHFDDRTLSVDAVAARALGDWYAFVAKTLNALAIPGASEQQIWPEHFDLALDANEVTFGGSPGDGTHPEPYLYVAPWDKSAAATFDDPWGWTLHYRDIESVEDAIAFFTKHV